MTEKINKTKCEICEAHKKTVLSEGMQVCSVCKSIVSNIKKHPESIKRAWQMMKDEPILPASNTKFFDSNSELPEVLEGKRYRTIDRDRNKWYLSVSEVDGKPVEVFASTAFDRDHELQSRISNLTTITRLISLILRHIFMGERITLEKCLKQIQRSSRQKDDLPDMLYGVLSGYDDPEVKHNDKTSH